MPAGATFSHNMGMVESHVISAPVRKRAELAGEIEAAEEDLSVLQQRLRHIDGSLAVFGYDEAKPIKPIRKAKPSLFRHGEMARLLLHTLRAEGPLSINELRDIVMAEKGFPRGEYGAIHKKVTKTLERQKMRGTVQAERGEDHVWRWSVVQR